MRKATQRLKALPPRFLARVIRRYSQLEKHRGQQAEEEDCCYLEHTDGTLKSCTGVHMDYNVELDFGYFWPE